MSADNLESFRTFYDSLCNDAADPSLESLRIQIRTCQMINSKMKTEPPHSNSEVYAIVNKICDFLFNLQVTSVENINIDFQFLRSTTLFSFISIMTPDDKRNFLEKVYSRLCELSRKKDEVLCDWKRNVAIDESLKSSDDDLIAMFLIHGYFHTNFLSEEAMVQNMCHDFLKISLHIVLKACMVYSNNTLMSFKNLNIILKKVMELRIEYCITDDIRMVLSYVILYNWENPLTGVKDINLDIFNNYIMLLDDNLKDFLMDVLDFPWNKAKYLTLSALLPHLKSKNFYYLHIYPPIIQGLKYTLMNSTFVSAGSDLYKVLIQLIDVFNQWYDIFYDFFAEIMNGKDHSAKNNLLNHWVPITIKKYPPLLSIFINNFLEEPPLAEDAKYSFLFILKIGRKYGQILTDWSNSSASTKQLKVHVRDGMRHINDDIRMQSIQIVCNTSKVNELPSSDEYKLVKEFFFYNANYDSAPFRQNSLNCFTNFLVRIRDSFIHITKLVETKKIDINLETHNLIFDDFFKWLYKFIMQNLQDPTSNYQRKIISLEMLDIVLRYMFGGYADKNIQFSLCRKSNKRHQGWKLVEYMKQRRKWYFEDKDCVDTLLKCLYYETNDIRQCAVNILAQYYLDNQFLLKQKNDMFINALVFCNSKKFYEVESGSTLFKLISNFNDCSNITDINILLNPNDAQTDILDFLIEKATQQFIFQKEDILYSIYNGQPLHGLVSAINTFIYHSNKMIVFDTLSLLLNLMRDIANFFVEALAIKSKNKQYPPSFADMGESINHIVETSKYENAKVSCENPQLSDAHQLVLNNIWLNLKACCDLSSTLITSSCNSLNEEGIKKCIELNISILTKCRHKGVIESAGVSLGQSVKYLTSLQKKHYNDYISQILENFLLEATQHDTTGRSITRRSAGLTILVHRIVSNDSQERKPLFYLTMNVLLKILNGQGEKDDQSKIEEAVPEEMANEVDLPMATALHLLCRTITESSLASYVIQYSSQLLIACFAHFSSEHWQIRNAALQLYGALVPKLLGQKSNAKSEFPIESSMSPDELFSHIPEAWEYIIKKFRSSYNVKVPKDAFAIHANLVPLLGLLSNMAKRYTLQQFGIFPSTQIIYVADVEELSRYLLHLLGSPMYAVRNLAAKTLRSLYSVEAFHEHWQFSKPSLKKENAINGYLILVKYYVEYYSCLRSYLLEKNVDRAMKKLGSIVRDIAEHMSPNSSYFSKFILDEVSGELAKDKSESDFLKVIDSSLKEIEDKKETIQYSGGFHCWLNEKIFFSVQNCNEESLCDIIKLTLNHFDLCIDGLLDALKYRFRKNVPASSSVASKLIATLLKLYSDLPKYLYKDIFNILYNLTLYAPIDIIRNFDVATIKRLILLLETDEIYYKNGYLLPLCCLILTKKFILTSKFDCCDAVLELTQKTKKLSNCNSYNEEVRLMCAISIRFLAEITIYLIECGILNTKYVFNIKCDILSTTFWLLQDEDIYVRQESAKALFVNEKSPTYPYFKLRYILSEKFLRTYFNNSDKLTMQFLDRLLQEISLTTNVNSGSETSLTNPFDHSTKNIYWELKLIKNVIVNLKSHINKKTA